MTKGKIGPAEKGSRYSLQYYMMNERDYLSNLIISSSPSLLSFLNDRVEIEWKSPLPYPECCPKEEFYEYRDDFLDIFDFSKDELDIKKEAIRKFWPKNGPQWDGLAIVKDVNDKKGALLIEAKSHTGETYSSIGSTVCASSKQKINDSLDLVQSKLGIPSGVWTQEFYQLSNRLAFLYFMNEELKIPSWLVLINFIKDPFKPTLLKEWIQHYNYLFKKMGIHEKMKLMDRIIMVYPEGKSEPETAK